jgi:hypothetical protein
MLKQGPGFYTLSMFSKRKMLESSETNRNTRIVMTKLRRQGNCSDVSNFEQILCMIQRNKQRTESLELDLNQVMKLNSLLAACTLDLRTEF